MNNSEPQTVLYVPRRLAGIGRCALSQDNGAKYAMHNIRLVAGNNDFRLEATDGKVAVVVRANCPTSLADRPDPNKLGGLQRVTGFGKEALVNARDFTTFLKGCETPSAAVRIGQSSVVLSDGKDEMVVPISLQKYPDLETVFPKEKPLAVFKFNPSYLMDLLRVFTDLMDARDDQDISLIFYNVNGPIGVSKVIKGGEIVIDGIIMPIK